MHGSRTICNFVLECVNLAYRQAYQIIHVVRGLG